MRLQSFKVFSILIILCGLFSIAAFSNASAQDSGTLTVSVSEKGGVIPKAVVILTSSVSDKSYRRITNDKGVAQFPEIPTGDYKVRVTFIGFAAHKQDLTLNSGNQNLDVRLTLAKFSDTVTITTANRREELLRNVAEPTTVIDEADIQDTGGRTAKDILQEQVGAGVYVEKGGGQGHVSINGVSNKGVLILIDGRRWLGKNSLGEVNLEDLDMSQFERVEIIKGAGSAIYGSEALGGVINFISKKPDESGVNNNLNVTYGSYNDTKVSDSLTFREGDFSGTIAGSYRTYDGYDLDDEDPQTQGQPESEYYSFNTNLEYRGSDRLTFRGILDYNQRKIDNYYFSGATQMGTEIYNSQQDKTRFTVSPEVDYLLTDNTLVNLRYNYSKYNREETQVYPTFTDELAPWQEWNNEFNGSLSHSFDAMGQTHFLRGGYEYRNQKMDRPTIVSPETGESEINRDINVAWGQTEINLSKQFKLSAGFRYDSYSDFGEEFSPKFSAMFAPNDQNRVRFSYGHGFRAPSFGELFIQIGSFFTGNPDLEPETSDNLTFGYTYSDHLVQASVDYFYNKIQNGIVFDFGVFPYTYNNLTEFTAKGINAELAINLPAGFTPSAAFSYTQREDEEGEEILGWAKYNGTVKLLWANPRLGVRANIRAMLNDKVETSSGITTPAYQMWYAHISKSLTSYGPYSFNLFAQVDNLLDEKDIFRQDADGQPVQGELVNVWLPPRTFLFGITIDMDFNK